MRAALLCPRTAGAGDVALGCWQWIKHCASKLFTRRCCRHFTRHRCFSALQYFSHYVQTACWHWKVPVACCRSIDNIKYTCASPSDYQLRLTHNNVYLLKQGLRLVYGTCISPLNIAQCLLSQWKTGDENGNILKKTKKTAQIWLIGFDVLRCITKVS